MQVGGLIVFSGRRGAREKELEVQVRQDHRDRWHFGDIAIMQKMRVRAHRHARGLICQFPSGHCHPSLPRT